MLVRTVPQLLLVFSALIYKVSCQGVSLTFVVDNTKSMQEDNMEKVREDVDAVMNIVIGEKSSQISDMVLVTFNDPDKPVLRHRTRNRTELNEALKQVPVQGGGDSAEMALSGVKLALESSLPGSYIYVFTDASAKDYYMNDEIQQLCHEKQSQIVFVLRGNFKQPNSKEFLVYYNITTASSGLVIRAPSYQIGMVLKTFVKEDIKGNKTELAAQLTPPNTRTQVAFWIDDLVTHAVVTASGTDVHFKHDKGPFPFTLIPIITTQHLVITKYVGPKPGEYTVSVRSKSFTSVVVTGRSNFCFRHGFTELPPKSLDDTAPQPIAGTNTYLSILVTDPDSLVRIEAAQILDMEGNLTHREMPLKELWPDFYITKQFLAPSRTFKVALTGNVIKTGNPIRRIAKIPVKNQELPDPPVSKAPVLEIKEGESIEVARGAALTLTCKVSAYPQPAISWTNDKGITLESNSFKVLIPYDYISYLKVSSASEATYYCHARNSVDNKQYNKSIDVIIKDPFFINSVPEDITKIAYQKKTTLKCDVRSQQPLQIRWYRVNKYTGDMEHLISSKKYSILSNGTRLRLSSMDKDMVGKYTCKVYLQRDPTQKREFNTNVEITGFIPPKIDNKSKTVRVTEHMSATMECRIIEGLPNPRISWQIKAVGSTDYQSIAGAGSELRVERAALADVGLYKCVAENVAGRREQVVAELVVLKAPAVAIVEGASREAPYGSQLTLACRVTANPEPTVVWKDGARNSITATTLPGTSFFDNTHIITLANLKVSDNYTCSAVNDQGSTTESILVSVSSPFMVHSLSPESISVKYGTVVNLKCIIRSNLPMEMSWYRIKESTNEKKKIESSEQYTILSDGAELRINAMDVGLDGEYACRASLLQDPDEHLEHTTKVQIEGLVPPKIDSEIRTIRVEEHLPATINCEIKEGVPLPKISWHMKAVGSTEYRSIAGSGSELHVERAALADGGHYKCAAENVAGRREQVVAELVVLKAPAVAIVEGASREAPYGSQLTLACRVTANPEPTVVWKDGARNSITATSLPRTSFFDNTHIITLANLKVSDNYTCSAVNDQGSTTESILVSVSSPFMVHSLSPESISAKYGTAVNLNCVIRSNLPMEMSWYRIKESTKEKKKIESSEPYTILSNGAELRINAMDVGLDGEYACRASLLHDPDEHLEHTTKVQIEGLVPPKIDSEIRTIRVEEHLPATINCEIKEGVPLPKISWHMKAVGSTEYGSIASSGSELHVERAALADGGHYKCVAENVAGRREQVVAELVVLKAPTVVIVEGASMVVPYGSHLTLACRVTANPEPTVVWKDGARNSITATSLPGTSFYDHTHIITLANLKVSDNYTCSAVNDQGSTIETILVTVSLPFMVHSLSPASISAKYGTVVNLKCVIRSNLTMEMSWYRIKESTKEKKKIESSEPYTILSNGAELRINAMDVGLDGEYACRASLLQDPDEHVEHTTKVQIEGLVPPMIDSEIRTIRVKEHLPATVKCEIKEGVPIPQISWHMKAVGSTEYRSIASSGSELHVERAALADGGHYKCVAENVAGRREQVVAELVVLKAPTVVIVEGASMVVPYGSHLTLACRVTANPEPTVVWKDGARNSITATSLPGMSFFDHTHIIALANLKVSDNYTCSAVNDQGSTTETILVTVSSPFMVHSLSPDSISAKYGTVVNLKCVIRSNLPMEMSWYRIKESTNEKKKIESSEPYTILSNGAELRINAMDVGLDGEYACRASLLQDPDEHLEHTTKVQIEGLVLPKIDSEIRTIRVEEHLPATINCEIKEGVPIPKISWHMKAVGSTEYRSMAGSGSELRVERAALADGGLYKCVAENVAGRREQVVAELVVLKAPAVAIVEGASREAPYGSQLTLACRVTSNPEPTVVWKDGARNSITPTSLPGTSFFDHTHIITLANLKVSDNYTCSAVNDQGSTTESIQVSVSSPFMVHSLSPDSISAKYGTVVNLKCVIRSNLPMEMSWYRIKESTNEKKKIESSEQYTILSDGAELRINAMDVGLDGEYACRASLLQDPDEHLEHTTKVQIEGLVPPKIDSEIRTIRVAEQLPTTVKCEILEGIPKPKVSWQMKAAGSTEYRSIAGLGSELHVERAALGDGGHYKCVAENVAGRREQVVAELVVLKAPAVAIVEGASREVPYGSQLTLACRVTANPETTVVWKDGEGSVIQATRLPGTSFFDNTHIITLANLKVSDNYTCSAVNDQGSTTESILVSVSSPFIVPSIHPVSISAEYGTEVHLICDITSNFPMEIRWYRINESTSKKEEIKSSERYTILSNGAEMKINAMDVGLEGDYACRASLLHDPNEHVEHTTEIKIVGLVPPKIGYQNETIKVKEHLPTIIKCKNIRGVPTPKISWQMTVAGSTESRSVAGSGTELRIEKASLADCGHYKCVAENVAGRDERVVAELDVLKAPAVTIMNGTNMDVSYGSRLTLACLVTANPEPSVVWMDSAGLTIPPTSLGAASVFDNTHIIILSNVKKSVNYSCIAANDQGSTTESILVSVSSPFMVHSLSPVSISAEYGTTVNLKCNITSPLPMEIRWYRVNESTTEEEEIESLDQFTILSNGAELKINAMDVGLDGEYACRASLLQDPDENLNHTIEVEIVGLEAPEVTGDKNQTVRVDAEVSIVCNVIKGVPHPKISWQFRPTKNGKFVDIANNGNEWHTANITGEQSGFYKCTATNDQGTDEHVTQLIIEVPARIITEKSSYEGITGDIALRVPCDTIGYPQPVVRWDVNGSSVILGDKYAIEDDALIIIKPMQTESSYTCTATNTFGSDTKEYEVVVRGTLSDYGVRHHITILKDQSIELKCTLPLTGSSTIKWFINGEDMEYSQVHMSINDAQVASAGNYSCHVSDVYGSQTETYELHVEYPPSFKNTYDEDPAIIDWKGDDEEVLRCDNRAIPEADIEWIFNGELLDDDVTDSQYVYKHGVGHYTCKVHNAHGEVQRDFEVKLKGHTEPDTINT